MSVTRRLTRWFRNLGLPLLTRELIEQSVRLRTYITRMFFAVLLYVIAMMVLYEQFERGSQDPYAVLGAGRDQFLILMSLCYQGIYLFMPALASNSITLEKERDSLSLLFLTRLGPWTILFEKLAVRLFTMGTFLLTSLPLLALSYSFGGVSMEFVFAGIMSLFITMLQVGSIAICCSAFFRSTVTALLFTYVVLFFFSFGLPGLAHFASAPGASIQFLSAFYPPGLLAHGANDPFWLLLLKHVPTLLQTGLVLVLGRVFLVSRAFVPPFNWLGALFKAIDAFFVAINENRVTRGIILVKDRDELPDDQPVYWRETRRRSMSQFRHLARIFVALELPVVLAGIIVFGTKDGWAMLSAMEGVVWFLSIILISVSASSLISGERTSQTLDVLLTTPLTGREILRQKLRGVYRLAIVLMIPILTLQGMSTFGRVYSIHAGISHAGASDHSLPPWPFPAGTGNNVQFALIMLSFDAMFVPAVTWLAVFIGLRSKTQARAILTTFGVILAWFVVPVFLAMAPIILFPNEPLLTFFHTEAIACLSPVVLPFLAHSRQILESGGWWWSLWGISSVSIVAVWYFARRSSLQGIEKHLSRPDGTAVESVDQMALVKKAALSAM